MIKAVGLIIIILGLLVIGSAFFGRQKKRDNTYSSQTMNCVKGIFAIMIVLYHLSQHINGGVLFKVIGDTGYLSVAVFFLYRDMECIHVFCKPGGGLQGLHFTQASKGFAAMGNRNVDICSLLVC